MSDRVVDTPAALAWEADRRSRTGLFAALSAVLTLAGGILLFVSTAPDFQDRIVTLPEALQNNADGRGDVIGAAGSRLDYLADNLFASLVPAIVSGLGALLLFPVLAYLFRATRARKPMRQGALVAAAAGAVAFGVGTIATFALYYDVVGGLSDAADRSNSAYADAVTDSGAISAAGTIRALGALALGAGTILITLNAMRVGLLTRFLGVLGIIVGGSLLLTGTPLPLDQQGLIRSFWLAAIALLLLGRLPGGMPPAWQTGQAEPWPSNRPVAAAPKRGRGEARPDVPAPTPKAQHPTSKKRRKRRR